MRVSEALSNHARMHGDYPIESVDVYRRDSVTRRVSLVGTRNPPPMEEGRVIKEFSDRAMRRLIFFAKNCDADFLSMITLTYPKDFPCDGKLVKKHLNAFREDYLATFQSRGLWWLEFQSRGAPHFHILMEEDLSTHGPLETRFRRFKWGDGATEFQTEKNCADWLAHRWYAIVGSGDRKHLKAGTAWEVVRAEEGAWIYAASHAGKRKQKTVPDAYENVGGFWGKIGALLVEKVETIKLTTEDVYEVYGPDAMSSKGKTKKFLYDSRAMFENYRSERSEKLPARKIVLYDRSKKFKAK